MEYLSFVASLVTPQINNDAPEWQVKNKYICVILVFLNGNNYLQHNVTKNITFWNLDIY